MSRRRFAVIGVGSFGFHMARTLYEDGQDVLVVDRQPDLLEWVRPHCSAVQVADATNRESMERAGVAGVDVAVVALGSRIDVSIVTAMLLQDMGVGEILAKAVTEDQARVLRRVGASEILYPEQQAALRLARRLARPDVLEEVPFLEGYVISEVRAPRALWGKALAQTGLRNEHHLAVVALKRQSEDQQRTVPAAPNLVIESGDVLVVLARPEDLESFRRRSSL